MSRKRIPAYCLHKATGQAYVKLDGKRIYLGKHGTPESHERYAQELSRWQESQASPPSKVTFRQLSVLYNQYAKQHYRKNGKETSETGLVRLALKRMNRVARNVPLTEISPRHLKQLQELMIRDGLSRSSVNKLTQRIRRAIKWAVGEELCPASVLVGIQAVPDLRKGRTKARESEPVRPVPVAFINAIEEHVQPEIWAMVQFQLATGARPGEARIVRGCDLDMTGTIWLYVPESHKTEHHGKQRVIAVGPVGQEVLRPFLTNNLTDYLFGPRVPKASAGQRSYRRDSYRTAIRRACEAAEVPIWSPNQLRHNFATRARKEFGIEAARVTLGHSSAVTSEIYAERDVAAACEVALKIG